MDLIGYPSLCPCQALASSGRGPLDLSPQADRLGTGPSRRALLAGADLVERDDARVGAGGLDAVGGGGVAESGCVKNGRLAGQAAQQIRAPTVARAGHRSDEKASRGPSPRRRGGSAR